MLKTPAAPFLIPASCKWAAQRQQVIMAEGLNPCHVCRRLGLLVQTPSSCSWLRPSLAHAVADIWNESVDVSLLFVCFISHFLKMLFSKACFYLFGRQRDRIETEQALFHLQIHSPNSLNNCNWLRQELNSEFHPQFSKQMAITQVLDPLSAASVCTSCANWIRRRHRTESQGSDGENGHPKEQLNYTTMLMDVFAFVCLALCVFVLFSEKD